MRFLGGYMGITGKREDEIEVPEGITVGGLLDRLGERYGPALESRVRTADGQLRPDCRLFLGKEDMSFLGIDVVVTSAEMSLFFLTGMAGG